MPGRGVWTLIPEAVSSSGSSLRMDSLVRVTSFGTGVQAGKATWEATLMSLVKQMFWVRNMTWKCCTPFVRKWVSGRTLGGLRSGGTVLGISC